MKTLFIILIAVIWLYACQTNSTPSNSNSKPSNDGVSAAPEGYGEVKQDEPAVQPDGPKTVRDFFMLLPEKYFTLEGCEREKDKGCKKAREDYLKTFGDVVDIQNGYIKGGCDGGQACIEMAIFKRPDGTYLIGVATFAEMMNDNYFLNYKDGTWTDVSSIVPEFSKKNMYELPRNGTTVKVFAKKIVDQGPDFEASEKGTKLYDLVWKDGKFIVKR
jgi:hypothetical protein